MTAVVLMGLVIRLAIPMGADAQMYNSVPVWSNIANLTVNQGNTASTVVSATDNEGDFLTYAGVSLPEGATFNGSARTFSFTPSSSQLGSYPVTLSVTDLKSNPVFKTFYVNVTSNYGRVIYGGPNDYYANQAPYIVGTESYYPVNFGSNLTFRIRAVDPENNSIFYTVQNLPIGAFFDQNSGEFSWSPVRGQRGTYSIKFSANDGSLASIPFNVTVVVDGGITPVNQPASPSLGGQNVANFGQPYFTTSPSLSATAGQTYVYNARAFDPQGTQLVYSLSYGPTGTYINSTTGVLAWTAPVNAVANQPYQFTIMATDATGLSATQNFSLLVAGGSASQTTVVRYVTTAAPTIQTTTYTNTNTLTAPIVYAGSAFNISIRANDKQETIVSWDTNAPTKGEVVFGYSSQSSSRLLNYEFTTGQAVDFSTQHQTSLGKLQMNKTYYLRIIDRMGGKTDIGDEIIFIPMPYSQTQQTVVPQYDNTIGTASASDTLGSMFGSGWFILLLILIIFGLIIYLIATASSATAVYNDSHESEAIQSFDVNSH